MQGVALCDFDPGYYLIFGPNVGPLQYYSHIPVIVLCLGIALYVFFQNRKNLPNQILLATTTIFSLWVFFDSVIWATNRSDVIMFMWSLQVLIEPLVYIGSFYLLYALIAKKDAPLYAKTIVSILYAPLLLAAPTSLNLSGFLLTDCLAAEGPLAQFYTYGLELVLLIGIIAYSIHRIWLSTSGKERREIAAVAGGVLLLLFAFSWGNIIGSVTGDWQLAQFGLFGMPIFVLFLTYSIVRFNTFNAPMLGSVALVFGLLVLSFSLLFVQDVSVFRGVAGVTFGFVVVFSVFLLRAIYRDLSARKKIEELASELREANRRQQGLIHFITHEVKGFLTKGQGAFAGIVEGDYGQPPPQLHAISERALAEMRKGVSTVMDILEAANLQKGTVAFKKNSFDLRVVTKVVFDQLKGKAEAKGLAFTLDTTRDSCDIFGDSDKIGSHVIRNLIENAIHYTPQGKVEISVKKEGAIVSLGVKDSGIGITEEDKAYLFTEGGRGKESLKLNVDSTGYGLFIAKQIVEANEGSIKAESEGQNKGSLFTISFPEYIPTK